VGEPFDVAGVVPLERGAQLIEPRGVLRQEALGGGDQQVAVPLHEIEGASEVECRSFAIHTPHEAHARDLAFVSRNPRHDLTQLGANWAFFPNYRCRVARDLPKRTPTGSAGPLSGVLRRAQIPALRSELACYAAGAHGRESGKTYA